MDRVMLASGAMLIATLLGAYFFWSDRTKMLACAIGAAASTVFLLIASTKLRELDRGFSESDREKRGTMQSALDQLDD